MKEKSNYLDALITLLAAWGEPWGLKDNQSRHIYMNQAAYRYTNTPDNFDVAGCLDEEFPAAWAEMSDDFVEHDKRAGNSTQRSTVIETHYWYGKKELAPFISEKVPVFDEVKNCIGVMWNARPFSTLSPLIFIDHKQPTVLKTDVATTVFTPAELDIIFLILRRFSSKEIARRYNLSHKTIENRIHSMYQKADVHSSQQFEEYCYQRGLEAFIPRSLLTKGILFI